MSWKVARISRYSTLGTISDYVDDVNGFLISVGYRDGSSGTIYKDKKFTSFVSNLKPYFGLIKVGYFFTSQAINVEEAEEEADYVLDLISEYQNDFPIFFNVDLYNSKGNGRADGLDSETRYQIYKAFSERVENSGLLLEYSFQYLIDVSKSDELGAVIIRKYASDYPEIDDVTIDGWEYTSYDTTLSGTSNVRAITVYNDIAGWVTADDRPIEDYINSLVEDTFIYTGSAIEPEVYNPYELTKGVDYNAFYKNNVNVNDDTDTENQPTVTVYGLNSYSGSYDITFNIDPADFVGEMSISPSTAQFTGSQIKPKVTLKGYTLGVDYLLLYEDNIDVGTYTVTANGRKNYTGSITATLTITPKPIVDGMFTTRSSYYGYTGKQVIPEIVVLDSTVNDNTNYTLTYGENIDPGIETGTVTITGKNNLTGSITLYFDIVRTNIDGLFSLDETYYTYDSTEHEPNVICSNPDWEEGTQYTVEYSDNIDAGTATVTISGIYPIVATTYLTFTITQATIEDDKYLWTLEKYEYKYDNVAIEPEVIVTVDEGVEEPTYSVSYINNTNVGFAEAIVTGTGNYTGTVSISFKITGGDLADCICRCGEPTEDGLYKFEDFEIYDTVRGVVLTPYEDYYYDNGGFYWYYPYNASYMRVVRIVTGYYNYTGTLESVFPTLIDGIEPTVPKIGGISAEILFMNGGVVPDSDQEEDSGTDTDPDESEEEEESSDDEEEYIDPDEPGEGWIPTEEIEPAVKDIYEDADLDLIEKFPVGTSIQLTNCKYYSSPENLYPEEDLLNGSFYIYNYHVVCGRVRVSYSSNNINIIGTISGWIDTNNLYLLLNGIVYNIGDVITVNGEVYKNSDGTGGFIEKENVDMYIVSLDTTQVEKGYPIGVANSINQDAIGWINSSLIVTE